MSGTFVICGRLYGKTKTNVRRGEPTGNKTWIRFTVGCYNFRKKEMEYYYCVAFGKTAEIVARHHFPKRAIVVNGYLGNNEYTPKDGGKTFKNIEFIVSNVDFPRDGEGVPPLKGSESSTRDEARERYEEEQGSQSYDTDDGGDLPF